MNYETVRDGYFLGCRHAFDSTRTAFLSCALRRFFPETRGGEADRPKSA